MTRPEILLVRHGETDWSASGKHTGRIDLPLNDAGREQARALRPVLSGRRFTQILCSPLGRARETLELSGVQGDVEIVDDLLEWNYGDYEGLTTAEIQRDRPGWTVWTGGCPNGETVEQVGDRADRVVERLCDADGEVAVFAHGHLLRVLTARWMQLPADAGSRLSYGTARVCVLGWEHERHSIRLWNAPPAALA